MDRSLSTYFKWILSFIFVAAGILKMFSPDNTGDILIFLFEIDYNNSLIIVYIISSIEVILGLCLFLGIKGKLTRALILVSCSLFLLVTIVGYTDNWNQTCGCFGRFSFGRFDSTMVLRNILLVSMSVWIIYGERLSNRFKELDLKRGFKQQ